MKTIQISVKEFADLWGCTPRAVQATLKRGNSYTPIVAQKKIGKAWVLTVLKDWYNYTSGQIKL
jgi:MarR-like DNA-binding transcriptional regulator SgrR of sgrS sRNA